MLTPSLMVAPNGARKQKSDHPDLPITIQETAQSAHACFLAGADILHLHIRTKNGSHSLDPGHYKEAICAVNETVPEMPIQITTESASIFDVETQFYCLKNVVPAAASISIREMARNTSLAKQVYKFCTEANTTVQHILYSPNDVALLADWLGKGWVPHHMNSVIYVLGRYQPQVLARPEQLSAFLYASKYLSLDWAICAFGQHELACAKLALQLGGDIRIGFENNTLLPDGSPAKDNAQTVALAAALIKDL
mgnify:CR=1 FL=1|jgi:uncharacterized protein (DUF849 family)